MRAHFPIHGLVLTSLLLCAPARAATFIVANTANSGPGSLRQAMLDANATAGVDTITFNVPGADVHTITPTSALPAINEPVTINGASQPGYAGVPRIVLNGANAGSTANGLFITAPNCLVRALVINGFAVNGIRINGDAADFNRIQGCRIGTNAAGTRAVPNLGSGVVIASADNNTVGGTTTTARNIISGNVFQGVVVLNSGTVSNLVQGNYIGISAAGTAALSNGRYGVLIGNAAQNNVIGGTATAGALWAGRNVISGNEAGNVAIYSVATNGNRVQGNYIGTNPAGTAAVPNSFGSVQDKVGVQIFQAAQNNTIGGTSGVARNVISGNRGAGIVVAASGTIHNLVQGNYIGLNAAGTAAVPNDTGVLIYSLPNFNTIGGAVAGARNVISGNRSCGVQLSNSGHGNLVQGNYIGTNPAGNAKIPNLTFGVFIDTISYGNTVGGATAAAGNLISGNGFAGVRLSEAKSNTVAGNRIGTNAAGTAALPNGAGVVLGEGAQGNLIGGTAPAPGTAPGNLIAGNFGPGVALQGADTASNLVRGNAIGANAAGGALANDVGVLISDGASSNEIARGGDGNRIAFNRKEGVRVQGNDSLHNTIVGNAIFKNGGLGINLYADYEVDNQLTGNDMGALDIDVGPNGLQNFPQIRSVIVSGGITTVNGSLDSAPNATFALDFYHSLAATGPDPSGFGEGEIYVGPTSVTTAADGVAEFSFAVTGDFTGQFFTATASTTEDAIFHDTSEFSAASQAVAFATSQTGASD